MVRNWLTFLLLYGLMASIPALILLVRKRGWRPRFLLVSLLVSWTGGGWVILVWIAISERAAFVPKLDQWGKAKNVAAKKAA